MSKCARLGCQNDGLYQPLIRIKPSILPADGKDVLAVIRIPFTVCTRCRNQTSMAEVIAMIPVPKMKQIIEDARKRTGSAPNPDRTDVQWIRILGRRSNG